MLAGDIEVQVIKKDIKNMHLSVLPPEGRVSVSAPVNVTDDVIRLFVIENISWINRKISEFKTQERQSEREFVSGESHYLWGIRYRMTVIEEGNSYKIFIENNRLVFKVRKNSTKSQRENIMNKWYREQLLDKLNVLVPKWEGILGVKANEVRIKNMKTKWGTCNIENKRIWINLQLAKKPLECLEYIVVHELVHLIERNHNAIFKKVMDEFLPDWKEKKGFLMSLYWMNTN